MMDDDDHDNCGSGNWVPTPLPPQPVPFFERRFTTVAFEPRGEYYTTARGDLRCARRHLQLMLRYNWSYPAQIDDDPDDPDPKRAFHSHTIGQPGHRA